MAMIEVILAIPLLVLVWLYIRWTKLRRHWEERGVPYIPPHPFMGNLTFLQKENPATWMRRIYEQYKSPYVGIWIFQKPALIINSPAIAKNILVKDSFNFRDRHLSSGSSDPMGALNLFTVNDPIWTIVRKRLSGVFTAAKLKSVQPLIISKANELITRIKNEKSENMSLRVVFSDYTTDVIGAAAFGVACDATLTGDSPMRVVTREFMEFSVHRGLAWSSIFFWPEMVDLFRFSMFPKSSTRYFRKVFNMILEQKKTSGNDIGEPRTLLDALLKLREEKKCGDVEFSDDLIISQAAIFLQGGYDTSAVSLSFTIYELAHNPDYQKRLYQELLEAKTKNNNEEMDIQVLSDLEYLNAVVKESLRLYPAMGWLDRIAANDYQLDDKVTIKAGTIIYVNANGMHYDPAYFPDPGTFNPDRFLPETEKLITPFTYLPFGEGPRICIGLRFARINMLHVLSRLVLAFELQPLPNTPAPRDIQLERRGLFLAPGEHLYVNFIPRN